MRTFRVTLDEPLGDRSVHDGYEGRIHAIVDTSGRCLQPARVPSEVTPGPEPIPTSSTEAPRTTEPADDCEA